VGERRNENEWKGWLAGCVDGWKCSGDDQEEAVMLILSKSLDCCDRQHWGRPNERMWTEELSEITMENDRRLGFLGIREIQAGDPGFISDGHRPA
jgi:hypothetical protein